MPNQMFHLQFFIYDHVASHRPDGADPLSLPADISPGQALGWDGTKYKGYDLPSGPTAIDLFINPFFDLIFESLDGLTEQVSGGSITLTGDYVQLHVPATQFYYARLFKVQTEQPIQLTFDKKREFKTAVWIQSPSDSLHSFFIATGDPLTSRGFGFNLSNRVLKGWSQNGGSATLVTLETYPSGDLNITKKLRAVLTPATKVEYYVAGVKLGESTTNIPQTSIAAARIFYLSAAANSAHIEDLYVSEFKVYQEA